MWTSTIWPPHGNPLAPSRSTPSAISWRDRPRDTQAALGRAVIVAAPCILILAIVTYVVVKLASAEGAPVRCFFSHGAAAIRACQDVIASDWPPDVRAEANYNRGVELYKLGRHAEAVRAYEDAVRLKPDYAAAYTNMGIALGELGRRDDALRAYHVAIREKPEDGDAHYNLGLTLADLRRWAQALDAFREAARLNPADADALYNIGLMLNLLGRHEDAAQAYSEAVRLRPDYANAWGNLGITAYLLGRYSDSVEAFERARGLMPNYFDGRGAQRKAWEQSRQGRSPSLENR